jgi:hypothetical protein
VVLESGGVREISFMYLPVSYHCSISLVVGSAQKRLCPDWLVSHSVFQTRQAFSLTHASSSLLFPSFTSKYDKGLALTGLPSIRCPFTISTWGYRTRSTRFTHTRDLCRWLLSVASLVLVDWVGPVPCGTQWAPYLSSGLSCWGCSASLVSLRLWVLNCPPMNHEPWQ